MLSNKTVHSFLNSASVNMSKEQYVALASQLKSIPGLEEAVINAQQQIREKNIGIMTRRVEAMEHRADRLENARQATYRAIEGHNRGQQRLREKMEISERAKNRRQNRAYELADEMNDARRQAKFLQKELERAKFEM